MQAFTFVIEPMKKTFARNSPDSSLPCFVAAVPVLCCCGLTQMKSARDDLLQLLEFGGCYDKGLKIVARGTKCGA